MRCIVRLLFLFLLPVWICSPILTGFCQKPKEEKPVKKLSAKEFAEIYYKADEHLDAENYPRALKLFLQLLEKEPDNGNLHWKTGLCYLNSRFEKDKAIFHLEKACLKRSVKYVEDDHTVKSSPPIVYYDLARAYHFNHRFDEAIDNFNKYRSFVALKETAVLEDIDRYIELCKNGREFSEMSVEVRNKKLEAINSPFPEYCPLISADESVLIFTSRREESTGGMVGEDGKYYEDIYVSYNTDGNWSKPVPIDSNINTNGHESATGLSVDGQHLFIYKDDNGDGNLYYSKLTGDRWSVPEKMGSDINTSSWEAHVTLSADKNTLYFVSDRPGGYGGRDIYRCVIFSDGNWSKASNLGPVINTKYDEEAPFMHPDGVQLFFSSKGHKSMGGFDIFSSELNDEGTWSEPVNMGYPINSTGDDIYYVTTADGKSAYYSTIKEDGEGEHDIYMIDIYGVEEKSLVLYTGTIAHSDGIVPANAQIVVTDDETQELVGFYLPNSKTGKYLTILPAGRKYNISYEVEGKQIHFEKIDVPFGSEYSQINTAVDLDAINIGDKGVVKKVVKKKDKPMDAGAAPVLIPEKPMKLYLLGQNNDTLAVASMNEERFFVFDKLPESQNYLFLLGQEPTDKMEKLKIIYTNKNGEKMTITALKENEKYFRYESLQYASHPLYLINEQGDTIRLAMQNKDGVFVFEYLPANGTFLFLLNTELSDVPENIKVALVDETGLIRIVPVNKEKGHYFRYKPLSYGDLKKLSLLSEEIVAIPVDPTIKKEQPVKSKVIISDVMKITDSLKSEIEDIHYDLNKWSMNSTAIPGLQKLFSYLVKHPEMTVTISGHTDSKGTEEYNLQLSVRRANGIAAYLKKLGLDQARMKITGFGEKNPISGNNTLEGRKRNRRVEIKVSGKL